MSGLPRTRLRRSLRVGRGLVASLAGFVAFAMRTIASYRRSLDVRFPTPPADV